MENMDEARAANLKIYVWVLAALATALCVTWIYWYGLEVESRLIIGTAILACFALLGDVFAVRVNERLAISASAIALIIAITALGPTWAALAAIPSALFVGRGNLLRTIYEVGHSVTTLYLAGIAFSFASEPLLIDKSESSATVFYGTLVAGVVLVGVTGLTVIVLFRVKYGQPVQISWTEVMQPYLLADATNVLTAGLGVLALKMYGPGVALVVVAGSIGSQALVYHSREKMKENQDLRERIGSLEDALTASNTAFGTMIIQDLGGKDGYTHRHAAATSVYAADLAREMKLDDTHAERLRMAGLLHNIGLFGMPEELLLATGKLNSIAQHQLAEHSARGEKTLAAIPEFEEMAGWVRWHHERPDGRGYPDKLRGSWIPLEAKILAVAQAYAAMVLDQPYRPGMRFAEAREQLSMGLDTEFDGVVVRAFLRILDTESEGYRMADDDRFIFPAPEERERARPGVPGKGLEAEEGRTRSFPG
jgi:HD-GYP domain-containing protein (c-di-GMP phosphodiesterase class II)